LTARGELGTVEKMRYILLPVMHRGSRRGGVFTGLGGERN
jgi:hypothetical protein